MTNAEPQAQEKSSRVLEQLFPESDGTLRKGHCNGPVAEVSPRGTYLIEVTKDELPMGYHKRVSADAPPAADAFSRESGHDLIRLDGSRSIAIPIHYYIMY